MMRRIVLMLTLAALIVAMVALEGGAAFGKPAPAPFNEFTTDEDQTGSSSGVASEPAMNIAGQLFDGFDGDDDGRRPWDCLDGDDGDDVLSEFFEGFEPCDVDFD